MGKFAAFFLARFLRIIACPNKLALFFLRPVASFGLWSYEIRCFFQHAPPHAPGPPRLPRPKSGGPFIKSSRMDSSLDLYAIFFAHKVKRAPQKSAHQTMDSSLDLCANFVAQKKTKKSHCRLFLRNKIRNVAQSCG